MTDPTGGSIANITVDMLKRVAMARNPQAVAQVVRQIAATLGTGTGPVIRGIATAMGSATAATSSWAATASNAVQGALNAGALVSSEAAVTTAAGTAGAAGAAGAGAAGTAGGGAASGGLFGWFTSMGVAAQVATIAAAVIVTVAVAQGVGTLMADDPTAVAGEGPGTTLESGPAITGFQDGYKVVGVLNSSGEVGIVSVRGTTALEEGIPGCRFRHGGVDCEEPADIVELDATVYDDATTATTALCALLDGPRFSPPLADGWSVDFQGRVVTLDDWGSVDFEECDAQLGPPG